MTSNKSLWGPELDEYSRDFEPHVSELSWHKGADDTTVPPDLLTLGGMETALALSDPRLPGYVLDAELPFWRVLGMMRLYTAQMSKQGVSAELVCFHPVSSFLKHPLNNVIYGQIFKNYWGFLCVRYLLHATCLTLLEEVQVLDDLLKSLPPGMKWTEFSQAIAFAATEVATEVVETGTITQVLNRIFRHTEFHMFEGEPESDAGFFVRRLWENRDALVTLCSRDLLPGCTPILLAAWKWIPTRPISQ
ncbi:hypothetical protein FRC12_002332 [Ceratobasidium sp. 428]|nr:hypothetical protein FRC12_002332 [Ceratobasidium sp. 428]